MKTEASESIEMESVFMILANQATTGSILISAASIHRQPEPATTRFSALFASTRQPAATFGKSRTAKVSLRAKLTKISGKRSSACLQTSKQKKLRTRNVLERFLEKGLDRSCSRN